MIQKLKINIAMPAEIVRERTMQHSVLWLEWRSGRSWRRRKWSKKRHAVVVQPRLQPNIQNEY